MTGGWKRFWAGFGTALGIALGAVAAFFALRPRGPSPDSSTEKIVSKADEEAARIKEEIKASSDEALIERFNRIAEKEKKP